MGINISQLANEITKELKNYSHEVAEQMEEVKKEVAQEGAQELRSTSPKETGTYGKGWRATKKENAWVVHNATSYQLTHLLEKGHAKRGGGRVAARVHIKPVEDQLIKDFEEGVVKVVQG